MKIVNRETFLQLPANTLYHKYEPDWFGELEIKVNEPGTWNNDWVVDYPYGFIEGFGCCEWDHETTPEFRFDQEATQRDGLFHEDQLFAVYDNEDIERLITKLKSCIHLCTLKHCAP
jgi:hypothetical protein